MALSVDPDTGMLPPRPEPHRATLPEVRALFVDAAPNPSQRAILFSALDVWVARAIDVFGPGRIWLDGGFITHKANVPHDVDLVLFPEAPSAAWAALTQDQAAYSLLTLQDLFFMAPLTGGWSARLQPVGGQVDAFLGDHRNLEHVKYWHALWSSVKGPDGMIVDGSSKGYVEVVLHD